jgi:hypothetical protein
MESSTCTTQTEESMSVQDLQDLGEEFIGQESKASTPVLQIHGSSQRISRRSDSKWMSTHERAVVAGLRDSCFKGVHARTLGRSFMVKDQIRLLVRQL